MFAHFEKTTDNKVKRYQDGEEGHGGWLIHRFRI